MEVTNTEKGYKKTKLGWIPKDWGILQFDEVFQFIPTYSFSRNQLKKILPNDKDIFNIHYGDIHTSFHNEQLDFDKDIKVASLIEASRIENNKFKLLKEGDLIIADASEDYEGICDAVELKNVKNKKIIGGLHTFAVRDKSGLTSLGFRGFIFKNEIVKHNLKRVATGISVLGVSKSNISKILIPLPSPSEQTRISNALLRWDTAITKLTALIKAKEKRKKGLVQQLISGTKRLSGFDDEWEEKILSNYIEYTPRPVEKPNTSFTKLGIRSHGKGTFQNKNFEPNAIAIDVLYQVKEDDLIVNITFAWEGAIALVGVEDDNSLVSHRFPTYVFRKEVGSVDFFRQYIKTKKFRFLLELISPGGAGRNRVMSKKDFLKLKITIPNYDEQTAIAQILSTADKEILLLQKQLHQLEQQKKGMMQQLLTGKKRLKY